MSNKTLVLKRNASVDIEGIESKLKAVVDELEKVNSLAIHDDESNKEAKALLTQTRKDWKVFDDERKDFKKAILEPYEQVDTLFKKYETLHKKAIKVLADDSKDYEENKRYKKKKKVIDYFNSVNKHASLIDYADTKIRVINSGTVASYKREVDTFINKVNVDIEVIDTYDENLKHLIMVEYEKHLDLGQAQLTVKQNIKRAKELASQRNKAKLVEKVIDVDEEAVEEVVEVIETNENTTKYLLELELDNIQKIQLNNFLQAKGIRHSIKEI